MVVHAIARPGLYPVEAMVGEVELRSDIVSFDRIAAEITPNLPEHNSAEDHPEVDQGGNVDRFE